jgi:hypothetical protein
VVRQEYGDERYNPRAAEDQRDPERRRRILGDARKPIRLFSPSWSG